MTTLNLYKTYSFKDKDPIIDKMRTKVQDSGLSYAEIGHVSGVSPGTLSNWFNGATRRPQFASLTAVARAIDHDIVLVKRKRKKGR
jgi:transcriptional regulator with XRE-family HTH domain